MKLYNTYPVETKVIKPLANSIEPGQSAHPCILTRLYSVG